MKKIDSILYVEDELNVQNECSEFLEMFCTTLYLAKDGEEGLKLYKQFNPELIVSDIKMPNMDGIEMIKKIKELNSKTPVIFTTAFNDTNYLHDSIKLQVDGYILKPIDLEQFEELLIKIIYQLNLEKEQVKLKKKLDKNHDNLQAIFDFIDYGRIIINYSSKILKINDSLCETLNLNKKEIIGKKCFDILSLKEFQSGNDIFDEIIEKRSIKKRKVTLYNSKKERKDALVEGFVLPNTDEIFLSFEWL
ncbi:response regulator [Arcobacter arenosus]|uniref:response regulator n=1 Tax=Arcobacter arenosus TaxID=2576037 RepID=UPI003BA9ABD0